MAEEDQENVQQQQQQEQNGSAQTAAGASGAKETEGGAENLKNLELLLDIPLDVSVEVGRSRMLVRDLLQMDEGLSLIHI